LGKGCPGNLILEQVDVSGSSDPLTTAIDACNDNDNCTSFEYNPRSPNYKLYAGDANSELTTQETGGKPKSIQCYIKPANLLPESSDCVGEFSVCDTSCKKTYSITSPETGSGATCGHSDGEQVDCLPGEGLCPDGDWRIIHEDMNCYTHNNSDKGYYIGAENIQFGSEWVNIANVLKSGNINDAKRDCESNSDCKFIEFNNNNTYRLLYKYKPTLIEGDSSMSSSMSSTGSKCYEKISECSGTEIDSCANVGNSESCDNYYSRIPDTDDITNQFGYQCGIHSGSCNEYSNLESNNDWDKRGNLCRIPPPCSPNSGLSSRGCSIIANNESYCNSAYEKDDEGNYHMCEWNNSQCNVNVLNETCAPEMAGNTGKTYCAEGVNHLGYNLGTISPALSPSTSAATASDVTEGDSNISNQVCYCRDEQYGVNVNRIYQSSCSRNVPSPNSTLLFPDWMNYGRVLKF